MLTEGHSNRFLVGSESGGARSRPHPSILDGSPVPPFGDGLRIDVIPGGKNPQALLTILDRATHRRRRSGAAVKNLSHSSLEVGSLRFLAPPLLGTEHLG